MSVLVLDSELVAVNMGAVLNIVLNLENFQGLENAKKKKKKKCHIDKAVLVHLQRKANRVPNVQGHDFGRN